MDPFGAGEEDDREGRMESFGDLQGIGIFIGSVYTGERERERKGLPDKPCGKRKKTAPTIWKQTFARPEEKKR